MEPVPTSFHLGPFVFHTYGLGLAITGYVAFRYAELRLSRRGFATRRFGLFAGTMLGLGVLGARIAHVLTNLGQYHGRWFDVLAVWQGGLSSFGGIVLAAPVGYVFARRWWPESSLLRFCDALLPAIVAAWALGRLLGPQFMVGGGGHVTHQWFGLHYAGQMGKRVPVPLIQGIEDASLWVGLLVVERRSVAPARPGVITGLALIIWGVVRSIDERLLLGQHSWTGSIGVQLAGLVLAAIGVAVLLVATKKPRIVVRD